jgi:hypothetical protein
MIKLVALSMHSVNTMRTTMRKMQSRSSGIMLISNATMTRPGMQAGGRATANRSVTDYKLCSMTM